MFFGGVFMLFFLLLVARMIVKDMVIVGVRVTTGAGGVV